MKACNSMFKYSNFKKRILLKKQQALAAFYDKLSGEGFFCFAGELKKENVEIMGDI